MRTSKITKFIVLFLASMIMVQSFVRAEENAMKDADKATLEWHKRFAVECNNRVWNLLAKETRSDEESEEMVHAAHASYYHWSKIGEPVNLQRGEWLISHVYAVLERSEQAVHHAVRCLTLTEEHKFIDFDLAYAYEAMARAHAAAHSTTEAKKYLDLARKAGESIKREEDRKLFFSDLETGPWFDIE
ncbi:MAG: hypothetical protein JSU64_03865 [candidate division WOR-3 bacterium]|nr:MAG: hypothetical protein JSU64_03865 [candidate division WOR-3 bacterium]